MRMIGTDVRSLKIGSFETAKLFTNLSVIRRHGHIDEMRITLYTEDMGKGLGEHNDSVCPVEFTYATGMGAEETERGRFRVSHWVVIDSPEAIMQHVTLKRWSETIG